MVFCPVRYTQLCLTLKLDGQVESRIGGNVCRKLSLKCRQNNGFSIAIFIFGGQPLVVGWGEVVKKVHGTKGQPMNPGPKDRAERTT